MPEGADIGRYAHERWQWGVRSEEEVAIAYIKMALHSRNPEKMLLPAVRAAVAEEFRKERLKVEERVPWDTLLPARGTTEAMPKTPHPVTAAKAAPARTYLGIRHPDSTLDKINDLLKTHVWVWRTGKDGKAEGGMISWAELTIADIEPTIAHERNVIAGHQRRVTRLEKARELMERYEVTRFGDIPFQAELELRELVSS